MPRSVDRYGNVTQVYDSNDDRNFSMSVVYGYLNTGSRVRTYFDMLNRVAITYYWDHIDYKWIKSIYPLPEDFVYINAPLTYNSNSSWRSFNKFEKIPYKPPYPARSE